MSIWAEPETPRRAVIIGINRYADNEIPELTGAENDAREMYEKLRDYGGFEIAKNHFLIGPDATYKAIRKAISDLLWETDKCYLSVLYFSGHGFQDGYENGYIAPYDMKASEPFVCGIDMEELKQVFLKTRNKDCALLILDCCYSGIPTQGKGSAAAAEIEAPFEKRFGAIREETKTGAGKIILASSGKDERSRETKDRKHGDGTGPHPHGVFTFHLLEGLDGAAADQAGIVTMETLMHYVDERSAEEAQDAQKPKSFLAGTSGAGFIRIAVASAKYNAYISSKLEDAERWHKPEEPVLVFEAISGLNDVLQRNPREPGAMDLKTKINETLATYSRQSNLWWGLHDMEVRRRFENVYRDLDRLAGSIDFDSIVALDQNKRTLLKNLCRVSRGEWDMKRFLQSCEPFDNPTGNAGGAAGTPSPPPSSPR